MRLHLGEITFAKIDQEEGSPPLGPADGEEFPLQAWFRSVYHTPLIQFGPYDIVRAIQQQIHLKYTVLLALVVLRKDPLSGDFYDGQVLESLEAVPKKFWEEHKKEAAYFHGIVGGPVVGGCTSPDNVRAAVDRLRSKLS